MTRPRAVCWEEAGGRCGQCCSGRGGLGEREGVFRALGRKCGGSGRRGVWGQLIRKFQVGEEQLL